MTLRVLDILRGTTVDGPGFRTSIYLAGCDHRCPGCHNPQSWDFGGGREMTVDEIMNVVREEDFDVTLSGGDPLYQAQAATELARRIREEGYGLWIYTGFTWEEILARPEFHPLCRLADALVEGPFIEDMKEENLQFRGSSNQRIIQSPASLLP